MTDVPKWATTAATDPREVQDAVRDLERVGGELEFPHVLGVCRYDDLADKSIFAAFIVIDRKGEKNWIVRGIIARSRHRGIVARQWTVEPFSPDGSQDGVTSTDMREIAFGAIFDHVVNHLAFLGWVASLPAGGTTPEWREWATDAAQLARDVELRYERVARAYLALVAQGWRRGIIAEIARQETERAGHEVTVGTIRQWVRRARDLGFLARGPQGRIYGVPGPRLMEEQ